jgi:hypothetical protein
VRAIAAATAQQSVEGAFVLSATVQPGWLDAGLDLLALAGSVVAFNGGVFDRIYTRRRSPCSVYA